MIGELIRGHAEGVKLPYYSIPAEIAALEKEKACSESELRQTENVTGGIEEGTFFEPQRREYLELIHLSNVQAKKILEQEGELGVFNMGFLKMVFEVNHLAFTSGLYNKRTS